MNYYIRQEQMINYYFISNVTLLSENVSSLSENGKSELLNCLIGVNYSYTKTETEMVSIYKLKYNTVKP